MSTSTPRLRSGFPATPATAARRHNNPQTPSSAGSPSHGRGSSARSPSLPLAPEKTQPQGAVSQPVIPLTVLDAPQQRLYAFGVYVLLWAWKFYDWLQVVEDGDYSWLLFLKWIFIDFVFLFGVPELRIPWLELSQPVVIGMFILQMAFNYMLMFNIPIPLHSWLLGFFKVLYDRELSVSEHNVKVSTILNNHSLIMGKQIINILPEGSAILNPEAAPFCLGAKPKNIASLPIYFNATIPAEIELVRIDLETNKEEIIKISNREVNRVAKQIREHTADQTTSGFQWDYPVKKPGVYRLGRVLDEYKLEVQRATRDTYRCIQELSDLSLDVYGTPPLKIVYSRTINGKDHSFHFQSLQPDGFSSPLLTASSNLVLESQDDVSWVRPSKVTVGLNESMTSAGEWEYSIDEVRDAFDNIVKYADLEEDEKARSKGLKYGFKVKERPRASMNGCDLRNPFKVAKGRSVRLPVDFSLTGSKDDTSHEVTWEFSPINSLTNSGEHGDQVSIGNYNAKNALDKPFVSEPGLYTLKTVSSGSCKGEVKEPSSCLLLNPLEPSLSIRSEEIPDKCAGNSIGLRVDLDLVGTPPFVVRYDIVTSDGHIEKQSHRVSGLRSQLELVPKMAGHHKYVFKSIDDAVYDNLLLTGEDKVLEQVVKPAASAKIASTTGVINACLDSEVELDVLLYGEAPFNLEWEIVHDGKRKSERVTGLQENSFRIKTNTLRKGGEYILALSSVQDKRGCKTFLQDQVKIAVRRQQPRAAFGFVEHKQKIMAVEDTHLRLPLRLEGEPPFEISYRNLNGNGEVLTKRANNANDNLLVKSQGVYELVDVRDSQCPGSVVPTASQFEVGWFPRPEISIVESPSITSDGNTLVKQDICEGDIDGFEVNLKGSPPYHVEYEVTHKSFQGAKAFTRKDFDAALAKAAISMDTTKAGDYTYKFSALADNLYNSDKNFSPLTVAQRVNAKPAAGFTKPGQSFKYCMEEQEHEDKIPIKLTGVAPFYVEVEIKHQAGSPAETYRIPSIDSNTYGIRIPRQHLRLGAQQVRIRTVRDARGCQRKYEIGGPSVQIHLYEAPSIYPLESRRDYCVGERIAYTLSGTPPFDISYDFNGRWNAKSQTTNFRRIAEKPGDFIITSISDKASECRAAVNIPKTIHPLPSVQISRGKQSRVDIHEGNEVDILFEFWGTPPFEFTYTRSSNAKKGQRSVVLETRHDVSYEHSKVVKASQEGTYEVVAIKDKFCSFSTQQVEKKQRS
ncbi:related to nuclear pore membrane protein POM152 [Fusarium fujikuroi IMI 58289]|uniref:Related to nuclear pore membrane protein POM152 n=1 Tax=Gibberella fujikuroi (strain CBS 195.34 / IMI 58289 / NRRL A-6831) TaxID=1279085 RepID=S0DYR3_GIBF5|nr:related to nuclear pore membrane protein POM152 [Fusarium fujikuroi IMI 58289]KLO91511.1 nuclear pore membrane protein [Fusarium fujikuroi]KLP01190.1 nuclear pore membrane protein [Fusarium fujikuroi]KLP23161.1 nuclear pore membrane protein [Fusarium fujikuroi]CCT67555.1 related to nuclear pore membrane protein POM152 [Fusarium fujikuroi IMI 58289]